MSPHLSVKIDKAEPPRDDHFLDLIVSQLRKKEKEIIDKDSEHWALIETAGGALSPGPTGCTQADIYRPLRLPVVLVGDSRLGGISSTISAYESLRIRGYDINLLVIFDNPTYQNSQYLNQYFESKRKTTPWEYSIPNVISIPAPPSIPQDNGLSNDINKLQTLDIKNMTEYYLEVSQTENIKNAYEYLKYCHIERLTNLNNMAKNSNDLIWYPFSQHTTINSQNILAIDSAHGDFFQAIPPKIDTIPNVENDNDLGSLSSETLSPYFDASASWWTQGLGHGNSDLALTAGYAAGRYGHVIFAGTTHDPALKLANKLIELLDNKRLQRVFYSDNGSTGIEVALKMAFNAVDKRRSDNNSFTEKDEIGVIGLKRSYHGDTIGSMDACEHSVYNEKVHWYNGKGFWFEFPQIKLVNEVWTVEIPQELLDEGLNLPNITKFQSLGEVFNFQKRDPSYYKSYIKEILKRETLENGRKFGAVILEPILLGAGGMNAVDPLFQKALVEVVRENPQFFGTSEKIKENDQSWEGLPIVFDEVFTGIYRLGHKSAAKLLKTEPDIIVNAKLLTGGLLPLCTTIASESIFKSFLSPNKTDGLLHGHSYTAHPIGCSVAIQALKSLQQLSEDPSSEWSKSMKDWDSENNSYIWSFWNQSFVKKLSTFKAVDSVFTMGCVLAITLKDSTSTGYSSNISDNFKRYLVEKNVSSEGSFNMHIRGLGNVLYVMSSLTSKPENLGQIEKLLLEYFC